MLLLLGEALFALLIIVFIMWWTLKGADTPHQAHTKQAASKPEPSSIQDVLKGAVTISPKEKR
jgi:hypothetical protein